LAVVPENVRIQGQSGKLGMRQQKADIEKWTAIKINVGDPHEEN
jgi:hypothetical protein